MGEEAVVEERRELSDVEKKIVSRQMEDLKERKEYENYAIHNADLMLNEGLWQNFKKQKREYQIKKRTAVENVLDIDRTLVVLQEQLAKGVVKKVEDDGGS